MTSSKEDKILSKHLFTLEGYNTMSFLAKVERRQCLQVVASQSTVVLQMQYTA